MGLIKRGLRARDVKKHARTLGGHMEDPGAAFDLAHERQLRALQQLRASSAQLVASGKRLEVQGLNVRTRRSRLDEQARRSLAAGREAEAVDLLTQAQELARQVEDIDARVAQIAELRARLESSGRRLEAKVLAMRTQAETMRAQYGAAKATADAGEAMAGLGPEDSELSLLVEQAHDKILWTQARAEAVGELLAGGTLRSAGGDQGTELSRRLDEAAVPERVQARLAELRADLAGLEPGTGDGPGPEPGPGARDFFP